MTYWLAHRFCIARRRDFLERIFRLQENQTIIRRELFAGLTTVPFVGATRELWRIRARPLPVAHKTLFPSRYAFLASE